MTPTEEAIKKAGLDLEFLLPVSKSDIPSKNRNHKPSVITSLPVWKEIETVVEFTNR